MRWERAPKKGGLEKVTKLGVRGRPRLLRAMGWSGARTERPGPRTRRARDPLLRAQEVAGPQKFVARQRRILQYTFSWKRLSVTAGASMTRFYFRQFNGSIKAPQNVEFLRALSATLGRRILIIWNRLRAHRSKLVKKYVEATRGAIALEYLPLCAPELSPVEYISVYLKSRAMPDFCARDFGHLRHPFTPASISRSKPSANAPHHPAGWHLPAGHGR